MTNIDLISNIINGSKSIRTFNIEYEDKNGEIQKGEFNYRLLTHGEVTEIQRIEAEALGDFTTKEINNPRGKRQVKGASDTTAKINIARQTEATNKSHTRAIKYSLSVDDIELDEKYINELPTSIYNQIYKEIEKANNLNVNPNEVDKEIDSFPKNK